MELIVLLYFKLPFYEFGAEGLCMLACLATLTRSDYYVYENKN